MAIVRAFVGTAIAFVVATSLLWLKRAWLLGVWLSPLADFAARTGFNHYTLEQASVPDITFRVMVATGILLTLPVFWIECWLLICRVTRRSDARRFTVPFVAASTCTVLLACWIVRQIDYPSLVCF